mmetsp:Transcript_2539/g.3366  ORF Transcript_2539/g.3366 Transcript_2539/m.3366 type:complete len:295 (-) Transcript_2539:76-960(-)
MQKLLISAFLIALFCATSNAQPDLSSQFDYYFNLSSALGISKSPDYPAVEWYYMLYYSVRGSNISFGVVCGVQSQNDWCGIGISPVGEMVGSDAVVGSYNTSTTLPQIFDMYLDGNIEPSSSGNGLNGCGGAVCPDSVYSNIPACTDNLSGKSANYTAAPGQTPPGYLSFTFTRPLAATDSKCDLAIPVGSDTNIIFSIGTIYSNLTYPFPFNMQKHYYTLKGDIEPYIVQFQNMPSPTPSPSAGYTPSPSTTPSPSASRTPSPAASASSSPDAESSDSTKLLPLLSGLLELIF